MRDSGVFFRHITPHNGNRLELHSLPTSIEMLAYHRQINYLRRRPPKFAKPVLLTIRNQGAIDYQFVNCRLNRLADARLTRALRTAW